MPFLFSHVEYCDMHYVYGYCDGNASAAVNEYRRRYIGIFDLRNTLPKLGPFLLGHLCVYIYIM